MNGSWHGLSRVPNLAYVVIAVLVVIGLAAFPFIKGDQMLPSFQEPYITVRMDGAPGTSSMEMDRIVTRASSELRTIPGVQNVAAHVGRAVTGDQVVGINSAELWVSTDPDADYDATVAAIQETVNGYPGLDREVRTYLQQTLSQPQLAPLAHILCASMGMTIKFCVARWRRYSRRLPESMG